LNEPDTELLISTLAEIYKKIERFGATARSCCARLWVAVARLHAQLSDILVAHFSEKMGDAAAYGSTT